MSRLLLNFCSGQLPYDKPWVNIDTQTKWKPDVLADCRDLPMFDDNSADMIVIHHGLEHFGCGEAAGMIETAYRILAPRGSLIVTVPDIPALTTRWIRGLLDLQIYLTNIYGAYNGDEADRHKWGYTTESLREFLSQQKWTEVKKFDDRPVPGARIIADWWILRMECLK